MLTKNIKCLIKDKYLKYFFIIFILLALIFAFTKSKKAYASEKTATQVLIDLGFSGVKDRSSYEYHFIHSTNGGYVVHFYADEPLRVRYKAAVNNHHDFLVVNGYYDAYAPSTMAFSESGNVSGSRETIHTILRLWGGDGYTKEDVVNHNYIPDGNLNTRYKLYYVSGNTGVLVHDNSMADLGYEKGSVFFFQGNYSDGNSQSPLAPPDNPSDPGLSDDDKSWFSGLFSGITQAINNVKDTIISGVTSAFEAVGQTIINGIKAIFIPDKDFLTEKIDSVKEKFAFIDSIKQAFESVSNMLSDGSETVPKFTLDLSSVNSKYNYGASAVALDMSWYSSFKPYVDGIIIAFAYISFIFLVFKRAPEIIKGSGATTGDGNTE